MVVGHALNVTSSGPCRLRFNLKAVVGDCNQPNCQHIDPETAEPVIQWSGMGALAVNGDGKPLSQ